MSQRYLRCRNPACPNKGGTVLGRLTADGGLVVNPSVVCVRCYLDTHRVVVTCPKCGDEREFRGTSVFVSHLE